MKYIFRTLLLSSLITIIACSCNNANQPVPGDSLINEVILAALKVDSIKEVYKSDTSQNPLCKRITPYIFHPEKVYKTPPPPGTFATLNLKIFYNSENNSAGDNDKLFSAKDTAYFLNQINLYKTHNVDENLFKEIKLCDYDTIVNKRLPHFKAALPLFSKDQTMAYIQIDRIYYGGGWSEGIILKKEDNKWFLYRKWTIWHV
jgi:hypothetical protein